MTTVGILKENQSSCSGLVKLPSMEMDLKKAKFSVIRYDLEDKCEKGVGEEGCVQTCLRALSLEETELLGSSPGRSALQSAK